MNKKTLQYLALSEDNLRKAEQKFLDTLPYDDGLPARRHSDRYYDFGGIMGAVGTIGKSVLQDGLDTTYEEVKKNKEYNDRMALSNISDNSALLSAAENLQWGQKMSAKDFRSTSALDDISDSLMAGVSGAASTGSPWGLLAALPVAGKKLFDRFRAKNEAEKWNSDLSGYNRRLANSLSQVADKVDTMNDRKLLEAFYNSAAFGGTLSTHGTDWDNGLTFINAGGTHESNPNDGVPAGKDENGTPNLVEEGEVIWNNEYVFSNRLKVPQKLRNKYKLGGPITYADAVKKLTKESEERKNDPISNTTNKAIVNEFIDSQEEVRAKKQQKAAERLQQAQYENELLNAIAGLGAEQAPMGPVDMQMPAQEVPQEAPVIEQMGAYGGNLFADGGPGNSSAGSIGYNKTINGRKFESQEYYQNFLNYLRNTASDKVINNWIGKINSDIKAQGDSYQVKDKADLIRLATDGKVGPVHQAFSKSATSWNNRQPLNHPGLIDNGLSGTQRATTDTIGLLGERSVSPRPDIFEGAENVTGSRTPFDWRREAPIIGGALQSILGLAGGPDYTNADAVLSAAERLGSRVNIPVETIGDIIKRRPYDERYMVNLANQNKAAAERGAANTAGGNRAMQLGADAFLAHSNQADLAEIMRQAYLANRQDEFSTAEFNRGTRLQNMSAINSRNLAEAQLNSQRQQAAFNGTLYGRNMRQQIYDRDVATTGANLSNLFNNLSLRGKEAIEDNTIQSLVDNGYFTYSRDPKTGVVTFHPTDKIDVSAFAKHGGKLKKKRRF